MRVPCDLDLGDAEDRDEAERLYAEQAAALRDALVGADTVLDIWREPLEDLAGARVEVDRRIGLDVRLPAHRLLPAALVAPERRIVVTAVCGARPLAEGRPPMGIACAQQDVARVYPLPDDPERCLEDFLERRRGPRPRDGASGSAARRPRSSASSSSRARTSTRPAEPRRSSAAAGAACAAPASSSRSSSASSSSSASPLLLARGLTGSGTERGEVLDAGARPGARRRRRGARPPAGVPARAGLRADDRASGCAELRRPGAVQILTYTPSVRLALTRKVGTGRVAWRAGTALPVVQCVRVRREGPLTGGAVELLSLSAPIPGDAGCGA